MNDMMMELVKKSAILDILEECIFAAMRLDYREKDLFVNSGDLEAIVRSIFPERYAEKLAQLKAEAAKAKEAANGAAD